MSTPEPLQPARDLPPTAVALAEEHATIQSWLTRIDEFRSQGDAAVAERVRADYRTRLDGIRRKLEPYLGTLREHAAALHAEHEAADGAYLAVRDALDEARLRYLAGETAETEWVERAPALEAELERAESERSRIEADLERWGGIFAPVGEEEADASATRGSEEEADLPAEPLRTAVIAPAPPMLPPGREEEDERLPWLDIIDAEPAPNRPPPSSDTGLDFLSWMGEPDTEAPPQPLDAADDELAFLAELDRSLAAHTRSEAETRADLGGKGVSPQTADREVTCRGCGSPHSRNAIFCDICGTDLP